ncbi:MAG: hypothetical protein FWD64_03215, partial [Acidobacteriaceae bacterium]|nr:hypothetical protein [Acidobacteriaceae bacterium]
MFKFCKNISVIAIVAGITLIVGFLLMISWIAGQRDFSVLRYVPALVSYGLFCVAVIRAVTPIEDMWHIRRTEIDTESPGFVYLMLVVFSVAVNLFLIALALVK